MSNLTTSGSVLNATTTMLAMNLQTNSTVKSSSSSVTESGARAVFTSPTTSTDVSNNFTSDRYVKNNLTQTLLDDDRVSTTFKSNISDLVGNLTTEKTGFSETYNRSVSEIVGHITTKRSLTDGNITTINPINQTNYSDLIGNLTTESLPINGSYLENVLNVTTAPTTVTSEINKFGNVTKLTTNVTKFDNHTSSGIISENVTQSGITDLITENINTTAGWNITKTIQQVKTNLTETVTQALINATESFNHTISESPTESSFLTNPTDIYGLWNATTSPNVITSNFTENVNTSANFSLGLGDIVNGSLNNLTAGIVRQQPRLGTNYSLQYFLGEMIVVVILLGILTVWTMFGNLLVLIALGKFKNLKTMSNYLIGNLALCDFLLALTVLPLSLINDVLGHWIFGQVICNVWLSIDVLYCTASIWSLCVIAVDRFTATSFPVWYREKRSVKRASVYISLVWVFSIIVTVPPLLGWQDRSMNYRFDNQTNTYQCILFEKIEYVIYSAMGSFIIPLFLMIVLYVNIFIVIRRRSKQMQRAYLKTHPHRRSRGSSKKAVTIQQCSHNNKPKPNPPQAIELNTIPKVQNNTKPDDSKLLFSCSTDSSPDIDSKSSDDDEMSDVVISVGYYSEKDTCQTLLHKELNNGIMSTTEATDSDTLVITNPASKFTGETDKESQSDQEKTNLVSKKNSNISAKSSDQNKNNPGLTSGDNTAGDDDDDEKKKLNLPGRGNPFKRDRMRSSFRKFDKREQRATKRMGMIISCFIICWMPFTIMYLTRSLCAYCEELNPNLQAFIIWLGYANSGLNPLLYTIFNEDFRKAFYRMLCGCFIKPKAAKPVKC